uniref:Putative secreted protein n=1 Tax=Anopheles darlingi TaxID=43151 RepID=A0A2M4D0K1_ANODA
MAFQCTCVLAWRGVATATMRQIAAQNTTTTSPLSLSCSLSSPICLSASSSFHCAGGLQRGKPVDRRRRLWPRPHHLYYTGSGVE